MKVLVTGANGQLGRSLRRSFASAPVIYTDVEELDITDLAAIRAMVAREGIDTIVNCAAYTNVDAAEDNPALAEKLNAGAVENLAIAMKEVNGLLVQISTDYVYGGKPHHSPIPEDEEPAPQGVYAVTKLHGEEAIRRIGCRHVIIRTAWLYSEFGKNFVKTMLRLTSEKPSIQVVNDQHGTPTYAGDLADTIVKMLSLVKNRKDIEIKEEGEVFSLASALFLASEKTSPSSDYIFHYTNEGECTWYEFAKTIAEYAGHTGCEIRPCTSDEFPSKVHRPAYSVLDKSKIKSALGISIPHWTDSLKKCLGSL
jgi:dTDP-4-dehydrorhamnose reductase